MVGSDAGTYLCTSTPLLQARAHHGHSHLCNVEMPAIVRQYAIPRHVSAPLLYRHNLRLRDAYEVYCLRHPNRVSAVNPSTVMEGKVLDHIFFDDSAVACARVLRLGEITDLPNATCPSDHYMAGAILVPRPMGSKSASPVVTQP